MTLETLLAELEMLTDAQRIRHMIGLGRQAQTDPTVAELLRVLAAGGFYERRLALYACCGSHDGAHALKSLSDSSRLLRGLAIRLIPVLCTDMQVIEALTTANQHARRALLSRLIHRKRSVPVDLFLHQLAEKDDEQLGPLLAFGSMDAVRRYLDRVLPRFGYEDWKRFARRHPTIILEVLGQQADALVASDARLLSHANSVLLVTAERYPDASLALVKTLLRHVSLNKVSLYTLAKRRPNEIADLILRSEDRVPIRFEAQVPRLTADRLLALVQKTPELLGSPADWMRCLPPETRRAVYSVAALGWRSSEGIVAYALVALLPGELRADEGRRHLALPALATRPQLRLPYATFLPWDEAQNTLMGSIRNPDADLRAVALAALIGAARYQREHLADALALVRARANEQDPIRNAMLSALAALPPGRWQEEHLDSLGQIIRDALSAADLSPTTASAAEKLIVALIPFYSEWSAQWLSTLVQDRGKVSFSGLSIRLNDRDVRRIAPALLPVFQSWETREREAVLIQAAYSFVGRLEVFPELVEILERVMMVTPHTRIASQILHLLAIDLPNRLHTLIPALIQQDASYVTQFEVYNYLDYRRQDLLTPFLGQIAYKGRFSTGQTRFVLPLHSEFERWTPSQQEIFAKTLDQVTRDPARDTYSISQAIDQLAALPAVVPTRLISLADRRMENLAVRDAALRALARLDAGQGVPVLIEALDDERARIAIYALRSALLEMPPDAALALLQVVPLTKVTVAKEVVRLLGELRTPAAYPALLEMDGQVLHRDVRVALLRAFWDHLEEDATWPILERAAVDPDSAVAAGVVRIPTDRLSPAIQQRLVTLIATLLGHPDAKIRMDVLARCVDLPLSDLEQQLLPRLLACLGSRLPDESAAAARAVFATYAGEQADAVGKAFRAIRENRRALQTVTGALLGAIGGNRTRLQPTVRAVLAMLEKDPLTAAIRGNLAISGLPLEEAGSLLTQMAHTGELHAEALMAFVQALEHIIVRREGSLEQLEAMLAASPDERLRRLALATLIAQTKTTEGWTEDKRRRLDAYRRDPSPLIAAAAQFIFPPDNTPNEDVTGDST